MRRAFLPLAVVLSVTWAREGRAHDEATHAFVELPLVDLPRSLDGRYHFPTWTQATALTKDLYELGHYGVHALTGGIRAPWGGIVETAGNAAFDLVTLRGPGALGWTHEEGHRSIFTLRGVPNENGFIDFAHRSEHDDLYGMTDAQMAAFKRDHPVDLIHAEEAGTEAQTHLSLRLERDTFFFRRPAYADMPILIFSEIDSFVYYLKCSATTYDDIKEQESFTETNRDFAGPDCTSWVHDLFHPEEPYAARGTWPSGGIRRPRTTADLTSEELDYLKLQRDLHALSFVDPMMFGVREFQSGPVRWNANVKHVATSFGYTIDANAFLAIGRAQIMATAHTYVNRVHPMPGVSATLFRWPLDAGGVALTVSPEGGLWLQPPRQAFDATGFRPGGHLGLTVTARLAKPLEAFVKVDGKTPGWVIAQPALGAGADFVAGVHVLL